MSSLFFYISTIIFFQILPANFNLNANAINELTKTDITLSENNFEEIFGKDYIDALNYFKKHKDLQKKVFEKHNIEAHIIVPVLFPERIRYSIVRDYFETVFLETVYKDYGSDYVDFSIGDFQMKPSFIEKLEQEITKNESLKNRYSFLLMNESTIKEERAERVKRLKSLAFQLNYISAFYDIIHIKFDISNLNIPKKIKFVASAYNYGFDKPKDMIIKKQGLKVFPYGSKYIGKQYAYTDIAVYFYKKHYTTIY